MAERTRRGSTRNGCLTGITDMTNTKKAAPIWSRLSEQLTRCALCVCDPK
ncbi:hypothetical protein ACLFKK_002808, partial [Escherichia coli]